MRNVLDRLDSKLDTEEKLGGLECGNTYLSPERYRKAALKVKGKDRRVGTQKSKQCGLIYVRVWSEKARRLRQWV